MYVIITTNDLLMYRKNLFGNFLLNNQGNESIWNHINEVSNSTIYFNNDMSNNIFSSTCQQTYFHQICQQICFRLLEITRNDIIEIV